MKILQVMPQYPWPMTDGGKVGLGNIATHYAKLGHELHVVCFHEDGRPRQDPDGVAVHTVDYAPTNTPWRIATSIIRQRALYQWKHDRPEMRAAIDRLIKEEGIDVLHCDHTCMAPMVADAARRHGLVWGFRLHNMEWMIWQRYAERFATWHPAHWYLQAQARKLRNEEATLINKADIVFAISSVDQQRALELARRANVIVAPAGIDPDQWTRIRQPARPAQVIMASNYRWIHNVDALRWFLDHVWPIVRNRTDAQFCVAGVDVPDWVESYAEKGVTNDGFVPDLADRYASARISVAPLFVGSGMRLKIIEAMASGLPVVATTVSAEGIELFESDGLLRLDTPEAMAESIVRLVTDPELCDRLGREAQSSVAWSYTWTATVGRMAEALQQLSTDGE